MKKEDIMPQTFNNLNFNKLLDNLPAGVVVHNLDSSIIYANKMALNILGLSWNQMIGKDALSQHWKFINETGKSLDIEEYPINLITKSQKPLKDLIIGIKINGLNEPKWVLVNGYIDKQNNTDKVIITFTDVTSEYSLPFKDILDKAHDAVIITEASNIEEPYGPKIVFVNDVFTKISGYSKDEAIGKTPRILQGELTNRETLDRIKQALKNKKAIREVIYNYSKNQEGYWLDVSIFPLSMHRDERITHFVAIQRDISEFKKIEQKYKTDAQQDPLTKLLNRRGFDILSKELANELKIHNEGYSIIIMDIDHFKLINDNYSHSIGDVVLKELSILLKQFVRTRDLAVRLGGEEFALFLPYCNQNDAFEIAERLRKTIEYLNIKANNQNINITISMGIASDSRANNIKKTLDDADKALYKAKKSGRNKTVIFYE